MRLGTLGDDEGGEPFYPIEREMEQPAPWQSSDPRQRYAGRRADGSLFIIQSDADWAAAYPDILSFKELTPEEYDLFPSRGIVDGFVVVDHAIYEQYTLAHTRDRNYTPFGGPRIWQETLESVGLPGDPIGGMLQSGQGPLLVAAVATAGIASGAFAGGVAVEESALIAAEGASAAEISAAEYSAYAAEYGTLDAALFEGPAAAELSTGEFSALADAGEAEMFGPGVTAPASETLSMPPSVQPSPPPSGGGFSMPSASTIAQKALPLALKMLTKSGSGTVAAPRPVAAPQPLYLTGSNDSYLTGRQDNRMLWIVGGTLAALSLLFVTRRHKGKRS